MGSSLSNEPYQPVDAVEESTLEIKHHPFPDRAVADYAARGLLPEVLAAIHAGGSFQEALVPALQHGHVGLYRQLIRRFGEPTFHWQLTTPETRLPIQHGLWPGDIAHTTPEERMVALRLAIKYGRLALVYTIIEVHGLYAQSELLQAGIEAAAEYDQPVMLADLQRRLAQGATTLDSRVIDTLLARGAARAGRVAELARYRHVGTHLLVQAAAQGNQPAVLDKLLSIPGVAHALLVGGTKQSTKPKEATVPEVVAAYLIATTRVIQSTLLREIFHEGANAGHLAMMQYAEARGYTYTWAEDHVLLDRAVRRDDVVVFEYLLRQTWASTSDCPLAGLLERAASNRARQVLRLLLSPAMVAEARTRGLVTTVGLAVACADISDLALSFQEMTTLELVLPSLTRECPQEAPALVQQMLRSEGQGARAQKITALLRSYHLPPRTITQSALNEL
jgi:hypothetical protein